MAHSATLASADYSAVSVEQQYNYAIVRKFTIAALIFGLCGMSAGLWAALQLAFPFFNFDSEYVSFGRLRPVHTSLVIFGFGGSALFATSYYVVQRTCQVRLAFPLLAEFTFWGWTGGVALGAITYMLGYTQGREYAEFIWPLDVAITVVWVAYLLVFVRTLQLRKQPHIYVANWFYLAFILATAILHIFNNLAVPYSLMGSYSLFSGYRTP